MEISDFLIRIIFIGIPGILGQQIYQKLKGKPVRKDWEDVIEIVLFAVGSYAIYGLAVEILHRVKFTSPAMPLQALFDASKPISWTEIARASLIGITLGFISAFGYNKRCLNRLGQLLRATKRFGDEDVWSFFLNLPASEEWVFIRDHKENLVYYGWIKAYSESEKGRELVIMDVKVYSNSGTKLLYEADSIYIARKNDDLTIEIPKIKGKVEPK
ncbi:MAG: hypothetical protein WCW52_03490 [Elusimicrobiales bacterium]|jgi:hypothetical protein